MLSVVNLKSIRGNRILFANLNFVLNPSELLLVEGENGSGKTTLLKLCAGLIEPHAGELLWREQKIIARLFCESLHYVGHHNGLISALSVLENLQLREVLENESLLSMQAVLQKFQLQQISQQKVQTLSAGQRRKTALLKLFLMKKPLWILDEPLAALDDNAKIIFFAELEKHLGCGGMAMVSTHQTFPISHAKKIILSC